MVPIERLTALENALARESGPFPKILTNAVQKRTAANLERKGWGAVEDGANGERIFRLNQAGENALVQAQMRVRIS